MSQATRTVRAQQRGTQCAYVSVRSFWRETMMPFRRLVLLPAVVLALTACDAGAEDGASDESNITNQKESPVDEQDIGNCWLYAAAGWVESLELLSKDAN